ncbi:MAG TPA: DUF1963 domain-containing protein, partial [Chitinophagales bacterium]|nr:DUF1963 domain-containing protein [Chitinophagales bacterium]
MTKNIFFILAGLLLVVIWYFILPSIKKTYFKTTSKNTTTSDYEEYRQELLAANIKSVEDLERLVTPLIKNATSIVVQQASTPPENSQLHSHFGGQPYFELGETWPKAKNGNYLNFIFQIYNNDSINIPKNIKLIQFFYGWEEFPWDTKHDGWLVKIYESVKPEKVVKINPPEELEVPKYCEIVFKSKLSLPDWSGIDLYNDKAQKLSCVLNEDQPWENYETVVEKLTGGDNFESQIGGYPQWVQ